MINSAWHLSGVYSFCVTGGNVCCQRNSDRQRYREEGLARWIIYNYPPKGRWIVVDIYRGAKRRGIYPPLFTDPEGDSCFSIYQISWIKKRFFNFDGPFSTGHFSLRTQNSEYPRIFQVTGANQNARKLLSTDLVNTNRCYLYMRSTPVCRCGVDGRCFYST